MTFNLYNVPIFCGIFGCETILSALDFEILRSINSDEFNKPEVRFDEYIEPLLQAQ